MPRSTQFDRRRWLQLAACGAGNVAVATALPAATATSVSPRARSCILLFMDGGPSHIDLWDLKPAAPAEIRGPYRPIATSVPGLQIGELMPRVAEQMHLATLVRSVRHQETIHDPAVYQMLTGYKHLTSLGGLEVTESDHPHLGAALARHDRTMAVMPRFVQLPETMKMGARVLPGQNGGFLGRALDPMTIDMDAQGAMTVPDFAPHEELVATRIAERRALLAGLDRGMAGDRLRQDIADFAAYREQAFRIAAAPSIAEAFELEREPTAVRDRYGRYRHGQSVLLARRLVEAGARLVCVYWGQEDQDWADGQGDRRANNPWDTHRHHFPLTQESLAPRADQTLSALLADLDERGMLGETLVVWMGDFGRTPRITHPWASRDHWPNAFAVLLAGGGMPTGAVFGATDRHAAEVADQPVSPADLTATIFAALGVDPTLRIHAPQGKSWPLSAGRPLHELM